MSDTAIAIDFNQALDVKSNFTAEVTLYAIVCFDFITERGYFSFGKILSASVRIDAGFSKNVLRALKTDTVNVCERDLYALVVGNINTSYTSNFDIYSFLNLMSTELRRQINPDAACAWGSRR